MVEPLIVLTGVLVVGLVGTGSYAIAVDHVVLGANAVASALAVLVVFGLEGLIAGTAGVHVDFGAVLPLWIAVAGSLHTIGMTGVYERVWWWDHLTHTVSAGLIGALLYGALLAIDAHPQASSIGDATIGIVTVSLTLLVGVLWEFIELLGRDVAVSFDREPLLVPYGRLDTALDLAFDVVGPVLVIGLDIRVFVPIAEQAPPVTEAVLWWGSLGLLALTIVATVALAVRRRDQRP